MKALQRSYYCLEDFIVEGRRLLCKQKKEAYGLCEVVGQEIKLPVLICPTKDFVLYLIGNEEPLY